MRLKIVCLLGCLWVGSSAFAVARFGTGCQQDFQNGWLTTLANTWERCGWFNDELDDTDTKVFYYNLHNAQWWWHEGGDSGHLDHVNLFYTSTHGGGWSTASVWSMWDQNVHASSTSMRLGDDSYGLSIFATYACETLKFSDGKMWTRMGPIFRGGLRIALGSHDTVWDSSTTNEVGRDFAEQMQNSNTLKYAWKDGNSDWATAQDLAVMATGADATDCANRRDTMKWQNYSSGYVRLRDSAAAHYCYTYWDNL